MCKEKSYPAMEVYMNERKDTIFEYVRTMIPCENTYKCTIVGCLVGTIIKLNGQDVVSIGISARNLADELDKKKGFDLAYHRAQYPNKNYKIHTKINVVPDSLLKDYINSFMGRCGRWFKNIPVLYPNNIEFTRYPSRWENDEYDE